VRFDKSISIFAAFPLALAMMWGCAVNPVTGKREIMIYSDADEVEMGRKAHAEVLRQYGKYEDPILQRYVNDIGGNLAQVSHRPTIHYQYMVVDKPFINAFALPGGYVYITRGMLVHLNSEAELAGVLGLTLKEPEAPFVGAEPFIGLLIETRRRLREEKHFQLADEIRNKLAELGITLEDTPQGTVWKRKR